MSTAKTPFQPVSWWNEHCSFLLLQDCASPIQRPSSALIGHACAPSRIFELSATLLIYVLTVLVWEVLVELKSRQT
jgi:hypothetical protein